MTELSSFVVTHLLMLLPMYWKSVLISDFFCSIKKNHEIASVFGQGIWDNLSLGPQAMVTHTWLQNKPFVILLEVGVVLLCLES